MNAGENRLRLVLIFLLIGNFLLLIYGLSEYWGDNPHEGRLAQQINPQKIRILSANPELEKVAESAELAEDAKVVLSPSLNLTPVGESSADSGLTESAEKTYCLSWQGLDRQEADALQIQIAQSYPAIEIRRQSPGAQRLWWVYVPAQSDPAMVQAIAKELQESGVKDYYFVRGKQLKDTMISLGVFSNKAGALRRQAALRDKGLVYAQVGPRTSKSAYSLEARSSHELSSLRQQVSQWLPDRASNTCR